MAKWRPLLPSTRMFMSCRDNLRSTLPPFAGLRAEELALDMCRMEALALMASPRPNWGPDQNCCANRPCEAGCKKPPCEPEEMDTNGFPCALPMSTHACPELGSATSKGSHCCRCVGPSLPRKRRENAAPLDLPLAKPRNSDALGSTADDWQNHNMAHLSSHTLRTSHESALACTMRSAKANPGDCTQCPTKQALWVDRFAGEFYAEARDCQTKGLVCGRLRAPNLATLLVGCPN